MAMKDKSGILVIEIPSGLSLLESEASGFIEHLFKVAASHSQLNRKDLPVGVLLRQRSSLNDFTQKWLRELRSEVLVCELTRRIIKLRALQAMIQNSPIEWCWAGHDSCLGSWFELSLSCHRRIWLDTDAKIGFPELVAGVAPWGLSADLLNLRYRVGKEIWEAAPVQPIVKAAGSKIISAVADASDTTDVALNWFAGHTRLLANAPEKGDKTIPSERDALRNWTDAESLADAAYDLIVSYYAEGKGSVTQDFSAEFTWQIQRDRTKSGIRKNFEPMTSFASAKSLISRPHVAWISGQIGSTKTSVLSLPRRGQGALLVVDLNSGIPPASCILKVLDDHRPIVLAASNSRTAMEALSVLYGRLEKILSGARASVIWDRLLSWYVGPIRPEDIAVSFLRDETFCIKISGKEHRFFRLEGNHPAAPVGWCESAIDHSEKATANMAEAVTCAKLFCEGILAVDGEELQGAPLYAVIRLLMLEEIFRASVKFGAELDHTLESLKAEGWGFVAHAAAWERFLPQKFSRAAAKSVLFDELFTAMYPRGSSQTSAAVSLRQIRELKRPSSDLSARRMSALRLSQHLLYFVGAIEGLLADRRVVAHPGERKRLIREAAGLPVKAGSPLSFAASRGKARTLNYLRENWPVVATSKKKIPGIIGDEI